MSCKDCIALSPKHGLCNIRLVGNWGFGYGSTGYVGRFKLKGSAGLTWEFFRSSSLIMWLVDGYRFLLIPVQRIHPLKMALSSWQCSSQRSTPTNLLQCALCLKCSILMVSDWQASACLSFSYCFYPLLPIYSVCRWKYMFRYLTESLEPYIWCLFYINFYTGENSLFLFHWLD